MQEEKVKGLIPFDFENAADCKEDDQILNTINEMYKFSPYTYNNVSCIDERMFIYELLLKNKESVNFDEINNSLTMILKQNVTFYYFNSISPLRKNSSLINLSVPYNIFNQDIIVYTEDEDERKINSLGGALDYLSSLYIENDLFSEVSILFVPNYLILNSQNAESILQELKERYDSLRNFPIFVYFTNILGEKPPVILAPIINHIEHTTSADSTYKMMFQSLSYECPDNKEVELDNAGKEIARITEDLADFTLPDIDSYFKRRITGNNHNLIIKELRRAKARKNHVLEFIEVDGDFKKLGGFDIFKKFIKTKLKAVKDNIMSLRVLILGIPGTGKSLSAKLMANELNLPLIRLNIGDTMGKYVGESEKALSSAFKTLKLASPCVVLMDEIEKQVGGIKSSNQTDGGTLSRLFANILEFLEENNGVHVIFTANDVTALPPEMIRTGRVNNRFFSDEPTKKEREEILKIHLTKNNIKLTNEDIKTISDKYTSGFVGSEIEGLVRSVVEDNYGRKEKIKLDNFRETAYNIIPQTVYKSEDINLLRQYAARKYEPVSSSSEVYRIREDLKKKRIDGEKISSDIKASDLGYNL